MDPAVLGAIGVGIGVVAIAAFQKFYPNAKVKVMEKVMLIKSDLEMAEAIAAETGLLEANQDLQEMFDHAEELMQDVYDALQTGGFGAVKKAGLSFLALAEEVLQHTDELLEALDLKKDAEAPK